MTAEFSGFSSVFFHNGNNPEMASRFYLSIIVTALLAGCTDTADKADLTGLGVVEAMHKIERGEITSLQLTNALIEKIKASSQLNAFITFDAEQARAMARAADQRKTGSLRGIPLVVKDNIEVAGMQHTAGTPGLSGYVPAQNASVIDALLAAGAIILGKTNMHELAFGITSNNSHFGAVGNPHKPAYFAGGSSGGTAAAIAAGMAPAGLGTDTGGSVRIPAALTGIHGFRPTWGRYPGAGITPISTTRDTAGIMARSIQDIMLLDAVILGTKPDFSDVPAKKIRLGVPEDYFYDNLEPGVQTVADQALQKLKSAGITLIPVAIPPELQKFNDAIGFPVVLYEARIALSNYLRERTGGYIDYDELVAAIASPDVAATFSQAVGTISVQNYRHAIEVARPALQKLYADLFRSEDIDGLIFPTTPLTARPIAGSDQNVELNSVRVNTFLTYIRNTDPSSNAGIPSISIYAGNADDLPVGIQIDAPSGSDVKLLGIALAVERILSGGTHR